MFDDWDDVSDPTSLMGGGLAAWLCGDCGEDGELDALAEGRCPNCGGEVERS